jgi:hypothetical protein
MGDVTVNCGHQGKSFIQPFVFGKWPNNVSTLSELLRKKNWA